MGIAADEGDEIDAPVGCGRNDRCRTIAIAVAIIASLMNENTAACQYLLGAPKVSRSCKIVLSDTVHSNYGMYGKP